MAGVSRLQYAPNIRIIRLMCTGRVDLSFVLRAFSNGSDGVFIGGCYLGECHYITEGNYDAISMLHLGRKLLEHVGISPDRLRFEQLSASEGVRFMEVMNDFDAKVKELGPLGEGEGLDKKDMREGLAEVTRLVPHIKMAKKEKLALRLKTPEDYASLFSKEEVDQLIEEAPSYYIIPEKCRACLTCFKHCPVDAIEGGIRNQIHVIDQDKCIKCGTCFDVCPPRFNAVTKLIGEPVPPPLPADERTIARKLVTLELSED